MNGFIFTVAIFSAVILLAVFFRFRVSAALQSGPKTRIHLVPQASDSALHAPQLAAPIMIFKALGFETIGSFTVAEIPGVTLIGMTNPQNKLWAIVNEHPKAGVFLEVAAHFEDGSVVSSGNSRFGGIMDWPPNRKVLHERDASPERLVALVLENLEAKPQKLITAATFQSTYEEGYAAIMTWRLQRGGPTTAEIRRVAATMKTRGVSEELIAATQKIESAKASTQLAQLCIENFVKKGWRPRPNQAPLLAIHDKLSTEGLRAIFERVGFPGGEEQFGAPELRGLSARHVFRYLNGSAPLEVQFRLLGRVSEPIEADIYEETN